MVMLFRMHAAAHPEDHNLTREKLKIEAKKKPPNDIHFFEHSRNGTEQKTGPLNGLQRADRRESVNDQWTQICKDYFGGPLYDRGSTCGNEAMKLCTGPDACNELKPHREFASIQWKSGAANTTLCLKCDPDTRDLDRRFLPGDVQLVPHLNASCWCIDGISYDVHGFWTGASTMRLLKVRVLFLGSISCFRVEFRPCYNNHLLNCLCFTVDYALHLRLLCSIFYNHYFQSTCSTTRTTDTLLRRLRQSCTNSAALNFGS